MNYLEFKNELKGLMSGNKAIPKDDILIPIVSLSLKQVAQKTEPLVLITNDLTFSVLQIIDGTGLFIREPKSIIDDSSLLDIDNSLLYAVLYTTASKICDNDNIPKYKKDADTIICEYRWNRHDVIDEYSYDNLLTLAQNTLDFHGYKKIYLKKIETINGFTYKWDIDFIIFLDKYLSGFILDSITKSDKNNFNLFTDYADGVLTSEHEEYSTIKALDNFLEKIVEILSPQYVAVENFVGKSVEDNKQKATNLLQALNDLQSINTQSKEYMSETQTIVKQAIEDAMKKALIFG